MYLAMRISPAVVALRRTQELLASLPSAVAASLSRCRAGTSLGRLRDPWQLRCGAKVVRRMPELVMQPRNEEEVGMELEIWIC